MVAAFDTNSDYVLLATPDVTQAGDLVGKKVGVAEAGSASEALTKATLTHAGLDLTKVNLVHVGGTGARLAALVAGQIQAGPVDASVAYDAIAKGTSLHILLPMATVLPTYEFHVLWASQAWLTAHPNLAQIAVNVAVAANRWAADNKAGYIALSKTNVTGLSDTVRSQTYDLFKQVKYFAVNGGMDTASITSTVGVDQLVGGLPATIPDPGTWTDASYVNNYLAANGTR
jgi:ABC-type nitrate/sulfonate/bicarbonate transport system substrate-binding protein